jgi:hypothetical protein
MKGQKLHVSLLSTLLVLCSGIVSAQSVGINTTGNAPDPSAMLDVSSNDKGVLIPRVQLDDATTQAPIASTPVEGLLIYNATGTEPAGYYYWDGSQWLQVSTGGGGLNSGLVLNGTTLELTDPGGTLNADLSSLDDNTDNDSVIGNEAINSVNLNASNELVIDEAGTIFTQDLSSLIADADADPTNEYNTGLDLSNDSLILTDNGGTLKQDLSSLSGGGSGLWSRNSTDKILYPTNAGDSIHIGHNARHAKLDLIRVSDGNGFSINQGVGIKGKASQYNDGYNVNIGVWGEGQGYPSGPGNSMSMGVFGMSHPDSNAFMTAGVYARLGSQEPSDWGSYSGNAALQADGNGIGQAAYFKDGAVTINFNGGQALFHVANGSEATLESNNSAETGYIMTGRNSQANIRMDDDEILAQYNGSVSTLELQQPGGGIHVHSGKAEADQVVIQDNGNVGIGDNTPPDKLYVDGVITATGTKNFRIQHPEKEGKVLYHAAIESDQRINKYSGNTRTDDEGRAVVELPDYVQLVNKDFRYNLTVIGTFAQAIVAEEFEDDRFVIETDEPNVKVSWELTGVRDDPYARENPYKPVRDAQKEKPSEQRDEKNRTNEEFKKEGAPSLDRSDR